VLANSDEEFDGEETPLLILFDLMSKRTVIGDDYFSMTFQREKRKERIA
jgi:hypothetical protein